MAERLSREAWIEGALAALAAEGPSALAVEPLARRLGVTKGSFYWHFADRAALRAAALAAWEVAETTAIMAAALEATGSPKLRLAKLIGRATDAKGFAVEAAIRALAATDAEAAATLARVDGERRDAFLTCFIEMDLPGEEADARARLLGYAILGALTAGGRAPGETLWRRALALLTA